MRARHGVVGVALAFGAVACVPPPDKSAGEAETSAQREDTRKSAVPLVRLSEASGVAVGTPVSARGVQVGWVSNVRVEGKGVTLELELSEGHSPAIGVGACVGVRRGTAGDASLELELGEGEASQLETLGACDDPARARADAQPLPDPFPEARPAQRGPGVSSPGAQGESGRGARRPAKTRRCGDDLSFATLSVREVDRAPLHLPEGGWRASIEFENSGDRFVEMDSVTEAAFLDEAGRSLPVATLPGSSDWFMGFDLPPHSKKRVSVTFHDDGGAKPWVERMKYSYSCS